MNMKNLFLTSLLLIAFLTSANAQNSKKEEKEKRKEENYQQIIDLVLSENFEFVGRNANPQGGRQIDLSTNQNFMRINKQNASADMPYFGRAFNVGYSSSDGGIKFDGPMEAYDVQKNDKKHKITIKYKVKGANDTYSCTLTISGLESASRLVTSLPLRMARPVTPSCH
jgi:hypothetical protein